MSQKIRELPPVCLFLALFSLLGAFGLLAWWFLMPVFLPLADAATNFQALILFSIGIIWLAIRLKQFNKN